MRWVGNVSHMKQSRDAYRVLVGKSEGKDHFKEPGLDRRIILKWIFRKWDGA